MSRFNGHMVAVTWLALFGMAGGTTIAQDTATAVTADDARALQGEGQYLRQFLCGTLSRERLRAQGVPGQHAVHGMISDHLELCPREPWTSLE